VGSNLLKYLPVIAAVLFILCIPAFLITTNLRLAVNEIRLYDYGFNRYNVGEAMGLEENELHAIASHIISYFNSDDKLLDVDIFSEREILHMKDVKGLVRLDYTVQIISAAYIISYTVIGFILLRGVFCRRLFRNLFWGGMVTVAFLAVLGLWAVVGFDTLFRWFHLASLRNDLWQLSPGDSLLTMFPSGFFNMATLFIAGAIVIEAIIICVVSYGVLGLGRKRTTAALPVRSCDGFIETSGTKSN